MALPSGCTRNRNALRRIDDDACRLAPCPCNSRPASCSAGRAPAARAPRRPGAPPCEPDRCARTSAPAAGPMHVRLPQHVRLRHRRRHGRACRRHSDSAGRAVAPAAEQEFDKAPAHIARPGTASRPAWPAPARHRHWAHICMGCADACPIKGHSASARSERQHEHSLHRRTRYLIAVDEERLHALSGCSAIIMVEIH